MLIRADFTGLLWYFQNLNQIAELNLVQEMVVPGYKS
jgi:hypothetical protein